MFDLHILHVQVCKAQLSALVMLVTVGVITDGQGQSEPLYLGTFKNTAHRVAGDIFIIDQKTIYIQDFAHDGQAPDVFFWADGVIVPYITRTNLEPQVSLQRFLPREDIVLLLPEDKPTVFDINKLEVWCRAFGVSFGHIDLADRLVK